MSETGKKAAGPTSANGPLAERAYLDLRDRIVTLQLPPGAILREDELMRELRIGRTPLREAIKRLVLENLVAVKPRRGTSVTDVNAADIVHIAEVRAELEVLSGSLDQQALMRFDERVHRFVWEASRNPYLVDALDRFFALSLRIWYVVLDRVPGLATTVHDQSQLLEAVVAHDAARARLLMREHVLDFQREILVAFSRH